MSTRQRTAHILGILGLAALTATAVVLVLTSSLGANTAPAQQLTNWTEATDVPATPHTASAVIVEQGWWIRGVPTCSVKLTNHRSVETTVSVYVVAESLDGAKKYRSALAVASNLVTEQSETIVLTNFGFGSGEDIPVNQPFHCRVAGDVTVQP